MSGQVLGTRRFENVTVESAISVRRGVTVWLSAAALTEWSEYPTEAFEISRSMLRGAEIIPRPRGHREAVALVATLHGRYVRWLFNNSDADVLEVLSAWVNAKARVVP